MRSLLRSLTARGWCFVAAGAAVAACGAVLRQPDLLRVGVLLIIVPPLSALGPYRACRRLASGRLTCVREVEPARVQAGQQSSLTVRLRAADWPRTGPLLAEDTLPRRLGEPPRFVLDGPRGSDGGTLRYQVRPTGRGKYTVGPLRVRVADSFGLAAVTRPAGPAVTLTVTPRIVPLPRPPREARPGDSDRGRLSIAADGDDDVAPRPYQVGDGLNRVHWRSTARHGELMVRREERRWRPAASLFLDTRRTAFGDGALFELAVTAAASVAAALTGRDVDGRLVTEAGEIAVFGDTLMDTLAVIRPSGSAGIGPGVQALRSRGGQLIAVLGALTAEQARQLAGARPGTGPAGPAGPTLALLVGESAAAPAAGILTAAGWRVAAAADEESLAPAWRELHGDAHDRGLADG